MGRQCETESIKVKRTQVVLRRTVRQAKIKFWRQSCESVGKVTKMGEVWGCLKREESGDILF